MIELIHWIALAVATGAGFIYFRDLGDVSQAILTVHRKNMIFAIRNEYKLIAVALVGSAVAVVMNIYYGAGNKTLCYAVAGINAFFIGFPYIWLHCGLRNQQNRAKYYSIEEARDYVRDDESVIVLENNGEARAHPDFHIKRPHLAGNPEGLGGENIIITYCCMTHLGHGYKPEIDGESLDLEVLAQHGNNLIMRDETTGEPIQQMYGTRERDGRWSEHKMQQWPTFRMPFSAYAKAYPAGTVFLNKIPAISKNPLLWLVDNLVEIVFLWGTVPHHHKDALLFNTMDVEDKRLRRKELVWGFDIGKESMAYSEKYIREQGNVVNATVGGRDIVAAYDPSYESVNIWFNDSGNPVKEIDFFGKSEQGELERVETVKAGLYWCVWINYFPESQLNNDGVSSKQYEHLFAAA
ncbi:MAG: DUF3179 domain-containing (seleno)protein [Pseudomonadales bacterium]